MTKREEQISFFWQVEKVALESSVVGDIAGFLYPNDIKEGGYAREYAKNRVRSTIRRYRQSGRLSAPHSHKPKTLAVPEFLTFACEHWSALTDVIHTYGIIVSVEAPQAIEAKAGVIDVVNPPTDPEELKKAFLQETKKRKKEQKKRLELEVELKRRDEEREKKRNAGRQVGKTK